jgi:hypothetical protein
MQSIRQLVKPFVPAPVWRLVRARHRAYRFSRTMRRFLADPDAALLEGSRIIVDLRYGWDNEGWAAFDEYQKACGREVRDARGPILECGSGLSTIVGGVIAQRHGNIVWALEHNPVWGARIQQALDAYSITSVRLCVNPLRDYGAFTWYAPPLAEMPESFALVLCDGPPAEKTPGGRSGMLPVMQSRLARGCVILMDDAAREHESDLAARWAAALGATHSLHGTYSPYMRIAATQVAGATP